jgi:lysophospholipase L1-like esterase
MTGRLVAFGDSVTYGQGMEDCHIEPNIPGPEPSIFAWPHVLAKDMNRTPINNSLSGVSNLHILWRILNFKFNPNDICVVQWTHFGRTPLTRLTYEPLSKEWLADDYNKATMLQIEELLPEHLGIKNYITMHHAYIYLKALNIKHVFMLSTRDAFTYEIPMGLVIPTFYKNLILPRVDLALDKHHVGPKSHAILAKILYNKINELY